jgi:hypothetical protein
VVTAGLFSQYVKVEGSVFNGREPDEQRADFDYRALDSYAGRVTVNPSPSFSAAAWYGYLESPEGLEPEESVNRYGFSLLVTRPLGIRPRHSRWSGAFIWSANKHPGERTEPSLVLESMLELSARHAVGGRVEWVRKSARDLSISGVATGTEYDIGTAVLSGSWRFVQAGAFDLAAGMRFAANFVPRELSGVYGSRTPFGAAIYVRAFPRHTEHAR